MQRQNRQLLAHIKEFLAHLKEDEDFCPFLHLEEVYQFGIGDFWMLNQTQLTIGTIEKGVKDRKYTKLNQFVRDMLDLLSGVQSYVFEDDPLQEVCEKYKNIVKEFA